MHLSRRPSPAESRRHLAGHLSPAAFAPVCGLLLLTLAIACSAHDSDRAAGRPGDEQAAAGVEPATRTLPARVVAADGNAGSNGDHAAADTLLTTPDVYAGWRSFNVNCQTCHGLDAVGSDLAPDLRNSVGKGGSITHAAFTEIVRKGRMDRGMPAWGALLDATQIDAIYAYLVARSSGSLGSGQPHVAGN